MLNSCLQRLIANRRLSFPVLRYFHEEFTKPEIQKPDESKKNNSKTEESESVPSNESILTGAISQKFKVFREEESPEILDVVEERERYQSQDDPDDFYDNLFMGLNLKSK